MSTDQLRAFGRVPFSYNEVHSAAGAPHGAQPRVSLPERDGPPADAGAGAPADRRPYNCT